MPQPDLPKPPSPEKTPEKPPEVDKDVFWSGANQAARVLTQVQGFNNAASLGFGAGAVLAAGSGQTGLATVAAAWGGALLLGGIGVAAAGPLSDWAGRRGAALFPNSGARGEALGRATLQLGLNLCAGSYVSAAAGFAATAGYGLHTYRKAEDKLKG